MEKFMQKFAPACTLFFIGFFPSHVWCQTLKNNETRKATTAEITIGTVTLNQFFNNRETGGGFVRGQKFCPKDEGLPVDYGISFDFQRFEKNSGVLLVHTMGCPQGNGVDQYIIYMKDNKGRVVANDVVGVFKMMGEEVWGAGDDLYIRGRKWLEADSHCCPSLKGVLKYDLKNGRNFFEIEEK